MRGYILSMMSTSWIIVTVTLLASWLAPAWCQAEGFPAPFNSEKDAAATPLPAAEAAATMEAPKGFRVGVFASEPDVLNPIAMAWDPRGRIWIAENHTYAERPIKMDARLRDRVIVFEDRDGDGRADDRKVFADDLEQLTSVEVGLGGVWLLCPPRLLFVADRNGDDVPDGPAKVMLDGFEVAMENYHNFANGLRFGPDGWLYGRCGGSCPGRVGPPGATAEQRVRLEGGMWRYSPHTGRFETLCHGTTNPWGHDWNAWGDGFFINTVNGHLWQLIPGAHHPRHGTLDPNPQAYELIDMHADHWHFDTGGGWQKSRDGAANDLGGGHAHSGLMIYLGDNWPEEYRGHLFTWNFHGRRANQELLEREGSGYVGRHGRDMLLSRDPFFRGMELAYGPDGAVLAIDWSDTGECHEATGVHRTSGRIFRIVHESGQPRPPVRPATQNLAALSSAALAELTTHANEWYPRQARVILAGRAGRGPGGGTVSATDIAGDLPKAHEMLRRFATSPDPVVACRAVLTLHACGGADPTFLRGLLTHRDEHLRAWGIRLITDEWPIDGVLGPTIISADDSARVAHSCDAVTADLCRLATHDPSGLVRLALASTLQRLPVGRRADLAAALMNRSEDAEDHNLPLLVWYGLIPVVEAEPRRAADLAVASRWPKTQRLIARRLASLIDRRPEGMERLVTAIAGTADHDTQRNLLAGIADGLSGWRRAPKPAGWDALATRLAHGDATLSTIVRDLSAVFGDGRAIDEIRRLVLDDKADAGLRLSALEAIVRQGGENVRGICLGLLGDRRFNVLAAEGLSRSDDAEAAQALVSAYGRFLSPARPKLVGILVSRKTFAAALLDAVAEGKIPRDAITAYDLRQIRSLGDAALDARLERDWGGITETTAEKRRRIDSLKESLRPDVLAAADAARGRAIYDTSCGRCHKLFGSGESIGPDLTGGNRTNIDYLLENIVDPSGVVNRDYRMSIVTLADGRVLNGLVTARDDRTLTLVTPTDRHVIAAEEIDEVTVTQQSPMPEGMLDQLPPDAIRDLIGYLMQPSQVPLP